VIEPVKGLADVRPEATVIGQDISDAVATKNLGLDAGMVDLPDPVLIVIGVAIGVADDVPEAICLRRHVIVAVILVADQRLVAGRDTRQPQRVVNLDSATIGNDASGLLKRGCGANMRLRVSRGALGRRNKVGGSRSEGEGRCLLSISRH
jgi:hypothetical protein